MAMRIRYKKTRNPGVLRSMQRFKGQQGGIYEVEIDINEMTYKVRNVGQGTILRSTEKDDKKRPTHINTLKTQAKRALESVGVGFNIEVRSI